MNKRLVIPSRLSDAAEVQKTIAADVEAAGYSENAQFAIRLALEEALSNAVRHGNCGDESKEVIVEYSVDDEQFEIVIQDEGCGFVPDELPDPTALENLDRPCGRGVMLMRAYMTLVEFNPDGNRVHMIKRKDCPLPAMPKKNAS